MEGQITFKEKWCYGCDEIKPLTPEYWAWADKEHTKFRNKCRKCTNFDSKISHRIHRKAKNERIHNREANRIIDKDKHRR